MELMNRMSFVFLALICSAAYAQDPANAIKAPATKLEAFQSRTGIVLIRGYSTVGNLRGMGGEVTVNAREFRDGSNLQVRHYSGGVLAGWNLGASAGLSVMNNRENPDTREGRADMAVNAVSTRHGGNLNPENFTNLANWIKADICAP